MTLDFKLDSVVSRIAISALAVLLIAPSLKIRFGLEDLQVYVIPFGIFFVFNIFANVIALSTIVPRFRAMFIMLFAFAGPVIAFYVGGGLEFDLLVTIARNMLLGALVIVFPWNVKSLHAFVQTLAVLGVLLAINTLLFYGSDEELQYLVDVNGESYLNVSYLQTSFAMGLGVICATYLVVDKLNPITLLIFATGWMGLAVGRGRGALIFCVFVSLLYLIILLNSKIASFGKGKKFLLIVLIVSFLPVVVAQTYKVSRNSAGIAELFSTTDVESTEVGRVRLYYIAKQRFLQAPLLGNGLGAYIDNDYSYPHNVFMQWAVDSGVAGASLLAIFWLLILRAFVRSGIISDSTNINLVFVSSALCLYVLLNYLKSSDAYVGRDINILAVMPIACHLAIQYSNHLKHRKRRRRRRQ